MSLLPSDRYLADLLGLTDEEYAWFVAEVKRREKEAPEPAVIAGTEAAVLAAISLAISVGSMALSYLLKPRAPDLGSSRPSQIIPTGRGGNAVSDNQRFAPRYGFNSTQEIASLGDTVPIIYSLREDIDGVTYGGVRVNAALLWSQIYSLGASQMLRGIFMLGEGPIASLDARNFASGGNTLASYDFGSTTANGVGARMSVYGRYDASSDLEARIAPGDHIFGRSAADDIGNANNYDSNTHDVFKVRVGSEIRNDFCASMRPSNQTRFGLYGFCGNDFAMRPNPVFEPQVRAQLIPVNRKDFSKVRCILDESMYAKRQKQNAVYSSRCAITSEGLDTVGGTTTYKLFSSADVGEDSEFSRDIDSLTTVSAWTVEKELIVDDTPAGTLATTQTDENLRFRFRATNFQDREDDLLDRLTVTVQAVEVANTVTTSGPYYDVIDFTNASKKNVAYLRVDISFDAGGGSESDLDRIKDNEINPELEILKNAKYKITIKNNLSDDDPEDDIEVVMYHRILVDDQSSSTLNLSAANTVTKDEFELVTGVTNSALGTSFTEEDLDFRFDRVPETESFTKGEEYTFSYYTFFSIKAAFTEGVDDIASVIYSRQKTYDDSLVEGELYKIGSGLAICASKSPDTPFESELEESDAVDKTVTFKTVRTGDVSTYTTAHIEKTGATWLAEASPTYRKVATTGGHIMRCALASASTTRACRTVEFGFKSTLGIRINGLANFNSTKSYDEIDGAACLDYKGNKVKEGASLYTDNYRSNRVTETIERYSFFKIAYRKAGTQANFARLTNSYGVRGATSQAVFNSIQLKMPSVKQWEFQVEPLSGYEVRANGSDIGTLYVLDASMSSTVTVTETVGSDTIQVFFTGEQITNSANQFKIPLGKRKPSKDDLGFKTSDSDYANGAKSYIDTYGKLAEAFIYEEITTSAQSGPEHELVYLNEIVPNLNTANYDNLALLGLNISSSVEWQQFTQFSCYVDGGKTCRRLRSDLSTGASHLFPDVALDLMTNKRYGRGDLISDDMIDLVSFEEAADWCYDRKYFFDGIVADKVNIRQWCADVAASHLLTFGEADGKFFLRPALQMTSGGAEEAVEIKGLFTAGNILENSFEFQYFDPEDREPVRVSVRYREERASTNYDNPGIFPVVREVLVRESSGGENDKLESLDMSDYCTNRDHAIDAAKFLIRMRRIPTHTVKFTTSHEGLLMSMGPGDHIKVAMDETEYNEFNNGVVTANGILVSTTELGDGTHSVIAWNGDSSVEPYETQIVVSNGGKTASPSGIVFTVKNSTSQVRTYQIERISPTEEGGYTIEAVHMPTDSSDKALLTAGFDVASNWTITD